MQLRHDDVPRQGRHQLTHPMCVWVGSGKTIGWTPKYAPLSTRHTFDTLPRSCRLVGRPPPCMVSGAMSGFTTPCDHEPIAVDRRMGWVAEGASGRVLAGSWPVGGTSPRLTSDVACAPAALGTICKTRLRIRTSTMLQCVMTCAYS
jgi:hypothetical protein